uniref:Uncharacterized protein n=1 Tax=Wuchereria bancrofti TaxID=6293 RepID=A0AAF5Q4H2_WUCBA
MNDIVYYNGSNYIERNVSLPYCIGQGLSCSLYNKRLVAAYFATVGNFIIIPFILYLIFTKVKDGFFKYFTLNLMIVCATSAIAALIIDAINIARLFISITESKLHLFDIRRWARFYVRLGSIWFHALTLYAVIICYLPYVKPFFYSKKFSNRSQKLYYAVLHTSVLIWSTSVTYLFTESIYRMPYFLTHIILFISLFQQFQIYFSTITLDYSVKIIVKMNFIYFYQKKKIFFTCYSTMLLNKNYIAYILYVKKYYNREVLIRLTIDADHPSYHFQILVSHVGYLRKKN